MIQVAAARTPHNPCKNSPKKLDNTLLPPRSLEYCIFCRISMGLTRLSLEALEKALKRPISHTKQQFQRKKMQREGASTYERTAFVLLNR